MILADLATKADLHVLEAALKAEITAVRTDVVGFKKEIGGSLRELELRMTVKLGAIIAAAVALIATLQKFL